VRGVPVEHGSGCTAGWTAVLDTPAGAEDGQARAVALVCWACGIFVTLTAVTPAAERALPTRRPGPAPMRSEPGRDVHDPALTWPGVPAEHAPRLLVTRSWTGRLPASIPPVRFAGVWLYVERLIDVAGDVEVLTWLVADDDGNVLGEVWMYFGPLRGRLWRWGAPRTFGDPVAAGEGCGRRGAAVRRLLAAVLPADDDSSAVGAPLEEEQG
jgi:hypothetical protein